MTVAVGINRAIDYIRSPGDDFETYVSKARAMNFRCVFAYEETYGYAREALAGTGVLVATAIDFPEGSMPLDEKAGLFETRLSCGFDEVDYVINQSALEAHDWDAVKHEMAVLHEICASHNVGDKVIVEMPKLDGDDDAKREVCRIASEVRPKFLKTSSGRPYKASLSDVELMREMLRGTGVLIKAAGGIRTYDQAAAFISAGASVLGASAGIAIVEGAPSQAGGQACR